MQRWIFDHAPEWYFRFRWWWFWRMNDRRNRAMDRRS